VKDINTGRYRMPEQGNENILLLRNLIKRFAMFTNCLSKYLFSCIVYFESLFLDDHKFENIRVEFLKQPITIFI
jgi:hypothetical protein